MEDEANLAYVLLLAQSESTHRHCSTHQDLKLLGKHQSYKKKESEVTQSCPTLCNPVECSLPDSSIHGILQTRILEWVSIPFSRGSSRPRDQIQVSCIAGRCLAL